MVVPGQVELSQVVETDGTMRASTSDEQAVLDMIRSDVPPDARVLHGPMFTTQFQIGTDLYVPVTWAAANNANRVLQSMALARADLTICNARGMNALHEAARHACLPMCKVLIALGEYDINAAAANGKTALHFAAASGNRDLCRLLVDKGARTSCVTSLGRTAAHEAARMNRLPALQYLVERGQIDPEQPDTYRMWTALHLASSQGHTQICRYLVHRCRVRIDAPDKFNQTAHDVAYQGKHFQTATFLASVGTVSSDDDDDEGDDDDDDNGDDGVPHEGFGMSTDAHPNAPVPQTKTIREIPPLPSMQSAPGTPRLDNWVTPVSRAPGLPSLDRGAQAAPASVPGGVFSAVSCELQAIRQLHMQQIRRLEKVIGRRDAELQERDSQIHSLLSAVERQKNEIDNLRVQVRVQMQIAKQAQQGERPPPPQIINDARPTPKSRVAFTDSSRPASRYSTFGHSS
ncbi:unnamed protein product (mitochondrion) [Plasmodiophora brassicae]|uniref:Uncharacterized protein n=1 Tax=Plasmodiophora brassicae TaxID=37360 RepID=A0A3P3YB48_PLABS|nr:unnamed protein product [Plasmodiophora brassicae]